MSGNVCVCARVFVRYKSAGPRLAINNLRLLTSSGTCVGSSTLVAIRNYG